MPLPVIGAAFVGGLVTKIVDTLVDTFSKKFLIAAALIAALTAGYLVLKTTLDALIASIDVPALPDWAQIGMSMMPSNTATCVSAIVATKVAIFTFDAIRAAIEIRAQS